METDVLREILLLAEKHSYAGAADALFISASALSRHVASLENQLGVTLFHRNSRSVLVTQQGELLLSYARKIVELENEYLERLAKSKREEGAGLRIGARFPLSAYGIMEQIAGFLRMSRELSLSVQSNEQSDLLDMMRESRYDFVFVQEEGPSPEDEFSRLTVAVDHLAAALPREHPLAEAGSVRLSQLREEAFLFQPSQSVPYRLAMDAFRRAGYTPRRARLEITGAGVLDLVAQGLGIALEQELAVPLPPGVVLVPLNPPERIWVNMVWHPDRLSAAGKDLIAHFRAAAAGKTPQGEKTSTDTGPA